MEHMTTIVDLMSLARSLGTHVIRIALTRGCQGVWGLFGRVASFGLWSAMIVRDRGVQAVFTYRLLEHAFLDTR